MLQATTPSALSAGPPRLPVPGSSSPLEGQLPSVPSQGNLPSSPVHAVRAGDARSHCPRGTPGCTPSLPPPARKQGHAEGGNCFSYLLVLGSSRNKILPLGEKEERAPSRGHGYRTCAIPPCWRGCHGGSALHQPPPQVPAVSADPGAACCICWRPPTPPSLTT